MDLELFLNHLSLDKYSKAALVFLSSIDSASATSIVKNAQIPQGRVYSVLNSLKQKGLVSLIPEKPKKYTANNIKKRLENYLVEQQSFLEEKKSLVSSISLNPAIITENKRSLVFYSGRTEHMRARALLRDAAKKEIIMMAPLFVGSFSTNLSKIRALERGVKMRVLVYKVTPENNSIINECLKRGAKVRATGKPEMVSMLIKDGEELLLGVHNYKNNEERATVQSQSKDLINALMVYFEKEWVNAKPIKKV